MAQTFWNMYIVPCYLETNVDIFSKQIWKFVHKRLYPKFAKNRLPGNVTKYEVYVTFFKIANIISIFLKFVRNGPRFSAQNVFPQIGTFRAVLKRVKHEDFVNIF